MITGVEVHRLKPVPQVRYEIVAHPNLWHRLQPVRL
jgi:hypothetical protein